MACSASPAAISGRGPIRSLSDPRDRRDDHRHPRPRERPQAGLQRRVALRGLKELGQQEDRAEHPEVHREREPVGGRERPRAEEAHRQHRRRRAQLPRHECDHEPDTQRQTMSRIVALVQPSACPRIVAVGDAEQPGAGQRQTAQVQPGARSPGLGRVGLEPAAIRTSPTGTLIQKIQCHEMPLIDRAADQRSERHPEAAHAAPDPERHPAPRGRDGLGEQRQREREHDRGTEALQRAGGDQRVGARRQRPPRRWRP